MNKIIMHKIIFILAGVIAAVTFASEASALPVFARQTGMECAACHFQHYPLLTAFGRSFKTGAFTMVGSQAKVEGDNLSIPVVVNAAVLTSMGYEKTNATQDPAAMGAKTSPGGSLTGAFYVPSTGGETSLFLGGRGSDFMGFLTELTMGGGAGAADSIKTPILFDLNGTRVGPVFFSTNGQGASYGFETLNTGANAIHSITNTVGFNGQYINAISAQQWIGTGAAATGMSLVVGNEMGFLNLTKFDQTGPATANFYALTSTYLRGAFTFDLAGWDSAIGVQNWRGNSLSGLPLATVASDTKATAVDGQMQGAFGKMPVGFYFSYATAPASTATSVNAFNSSATDSRNSLNFDAELGVVPDVATLGAAVRRANNVDINGARQKDNALYLTATYKMAQNLLARLSYVKQNGSFWDSPSNVAGSTNTMGQDYGTTSYTVNLYAVF